MERKKKEKKVERFWGLRLKGEHSGKENWREEDGRTGSNLGNKTAQNRMQHEEIEEIKKRIECENKFKT